MLWPRGQARLPWENIGVSPWPSKLFRAVLWLSPVLKDQVEEADCLGKGLEVGTARSLGAWAARAVITVRAYCVPGSVLINFYLPNTCMMVLVLFPSFTDEAEAQRGNDLYKVIWKWWSWDPH